MSRNKTIVVCLVAVIVVIGLFYVFSHNKSGLSGSISTPDCSNGATSCTSGSFYAGGTVTGLVVQSLSHLAYNGFLYRGSVASSTSIMDYASVDSCNTGSSTVFDIANPFAATSTATLISTEGTGNATSSLFKVGTTTKSSGLVASDVSPSFLTVTVGSTSPHFYYSSGITASGIPLGGNAAQAASVRSIQVAPGERIAGFATSTYPDAGAINYSPAFTSCNYKVLWND